MSERIEFTTLTEDDSLDSARRKSGEVTPLKSFVSRRFESANRNEGLQLIVLLFVIVSFCITVALAVQIIVGETQVQFHGGVASRSGVCSGVGVSLLKKGGNAVDAAIGTSLCMMVVEPQYAGLGGGGFMLIHDHTGGVHSTVAIDFRETAPSKLDSALRQSTNSNLGQVFTRLKGLSVGVPGEVAGMLQAHSMKGRLRWSELLAPAIHLAEKGFNVSKKLADDIDRKLASGENVSPTATRLFTNAATGKFYRESEIMKRPDLANLLRKIGSGKRDAFYRGYVADEIVKSVANHGGVISVEDIWDYQANTKAPLEGKFKGFTVLSMPAPSSGSLLLYTLQQMNGSTEKSSDSLSYLTQLTQVTRNAYRCRKFIGDDQDAKVGENEKLILNAVDKNDICRTAEELTQIEDHGTSHISVIDKHEMMVSYSNSLNNLFGSTIVTPSGIILNDEMADFSYVDESSGPLNQISDKRRPLSSMVPTIVYHAERPCLLRAAVGGVNGSRIVSSVAQTIIDLVHFGMSEEAAIKSPKLYCGENLCELEDFPGAKELAEKVGSRSGIEVRLVAQKLAGIGVVMKTKTHLSSYFDSSAGGQGIQY